ncbi:MAG: STAS domain-containing protein [Methylobacter sp.]|uniref:STAS domain-containing protein n=1 Tax=Candidatus Methylobacter titanis TaxID=3053457 RepID=A0AA43Q701_9GAMM|nr:STAS domain-containing protein [Candidatus Methylobacter titanis]
MATTEENDLIGYDPLAWMEASTDKNEEIIANEYCGGDDTSLEEQPFIDNEMSMTDDYSDDLIEDAEEGMALATEQDKVMIDETESASDSAIMAEAVADDCMDAGGRATQGAVAENFSPEEPDSQIDLDATLTIQNVAKLHEQLKNILAVHDEIEINASDVSSIDTATLQLLVSLKKNADKLQKKVTIIYPSPRFVESAQLLGLLDVLDVHDL